MIETALYTIFTLLLFFIFLYSLSQLALLLNFLRTKKAKDEAAKFDLSEPAEIPFVTVQLPLYNEKPVAKRLLQNIVRLDYPKEKLEIQVLDDSTDDSAALVGRVVEEIKNSGINISLLRRKKRTDFKAGALRDGLKTAKGEFIAVFDSDFLPKPDWLKETIPYFKDEKIGVVQTRWGHLNRDYSLLTQLQAFLLDFHFVLEQTGRSHGKHFINFNGTAGVWRKTCILDAGNWQGDTLTEDLDLSYRAQLKGWKFKYLQKVESPAELPVTIDAARSQQFRWNKGAAENFQKNYLHVLKNRSISFGTKFQSFFHLLNSSLFLLVLLLAIVSVPLLFVEGPNIFVLGLLILFSSSILIFFISYWSSFAAIHGNSLRSFGRYFFMFFAFFAIAMGLSVHNSIAILEGHFGKKSEFIRTPKFNLTGKKKFRNNKRLKFSWQLLLEVLLFMLFVFAVFAGFSTGSYAFVHFHLMLCFGFGYVIFHSFGIQNFFIKEETDSAITKA